MAMGSYIDQKAAMELAIASGKAVFTGPQAAAFNALRMNGMAPAVAIQTPAADGVRALPSTFPPHVRAVLSPSPAPAISSSSAVQDYVKHAAENADVQASSPSFATPFQLPAHTGVPHSNHPIQKSTPLDRQPAAKPLLSFHSNFGVVDAAGSAKQPASTALVPLLPASTLLSSDPSHFDTMLKDWTRKVAGQSSGASAAACSSLPAALPPAASVHPVFHIEADDDVLCIDSPIATTSHSRDTVPGRNIHIAASAQQDDEIICVSSSGSDSESGVCVMEDVIAATPFLAAQAAAADTSPTVGHGSGETKTPTYNAPRGILNFFSPISKKSPSDAGAADTGSSHGSSSATAAAESLSAVIPLIVNPVFTEVLAHVATSGSAESHAPLAADADPCAQRQSYVTQLSSPSTSNRGAAPDAALANDTGTFSIVVSMISGRNMSVELPRHLLQRTSVLSDDARGGGGQSPVDEQSSIVSVITLFSVLVCYVNSLVYLLLHQMHALLLALEQQHNIPSTKVAKFLVEGDNLTVT